MISSFIAKLSVIFVIVFFADVLDHRKSMQADEVAAAQAFCQARTAERDAIAREVS